MLMTMMMQVSLMSLVLIMGSFCSSTRVRPQSPDQYCRDQGYGPSYIKCRGSNDCVYQYYLCNGYSDCEDGSDEELQTCEANGYYQVRMCERTVSPCLWPVMVAMYGANNELIFEHIRTTDLRETCSVVLAVQECVLRKVEETPICQLTDTDHPIVVQAQLYLEAGPIASNFVCRENVELFDEHKECLLAVGDRGPAMIDAIGERCSQHLRPPHPGSPRPPYCPSPTFVDCAISVVSEECGQDIAGAISSLATTVLEEIDCY